MGFRLTEEEYQAILARQGGAVAVSSAVITAKLRKRHKYNAKRVEVEPGITMASKLQAYHYGQLVLLLRAGAIVYFTWEFVLRLPGGVKHIIDWMVIVTLDQPWVWADSKGEDLQGGIDKRKQVRALTRGAIDIKLWTGEVVL